MNMNSLSNNIVRGGNTLTRRIVIGILVVSVVSVVSWWFHGKKSATTCAEITRIGVLLPLTGETASFANPMKKGIEFAAAEISPTKYEVTFMDSQNNSATSVNCLRQLISLKGVKYVIGDFGSSATLSILPIAEKNGVFLFSPGAQSPKLRNISPLFARCYPSSTEESEMAADYVLDKLSTNGIAIIYVNDDYGVGLSARFKEVVEKRNGVIVMCEAFQSQQSDFRNMLQKIKEKGPSIIYLAANQREMGAFMKQYGELAIKAQIVSNIAFLERECLSMAGETANGTIVPVTYYNPLDTKFKGAQSFAQKFKEKNGSLPTIAEAVGYDALKLMIQAIENSSSPGEAAKYIRNLKNYDGASGLLNFTDGDVSVPYVFKQVKDGKAVTLD